MRKFINEQRAKSLPFPKEYEAYKDLLLNEETGSLCHTSGPSFSIELKEMCIGPINAIKNFQVNEAIKILLNNI